MRKEENIPQELFWDTDVTGLDPQENKQYIIERILELGDEKAVRWLFRFMPGATSKKLSKKAETSREKVPITGILC